MNVEYLDASSLVLMGELYPREVMSIEHVKALAEAIEAGADLPPLLVDFRTRRIVDGQHRYHAFQRVHGDDCKIPCALKKYSSDAEMFADAVRENAKHGLRFNREDHAQVMKLAEGLRLTADQMQPLLRVSANTLRWAKLRGLTPASKVEASGAETRRASRGIKHGRSDGRSSGDERDVAMRVNVKPPPPQAFEPKDKLGRAQYHAQNLCLLLENRLVDASYRELVRDLAKLKLALNGYLSRAQSG